MSLALARSGRAGGWSVSAHLGAIALAVVVVFVVVGAVLGRGVWDDAERDVRSDAAALAAVAAEGVADNVELIWSQLHATAQNPAIPQLLAAPTDCPLEFDLALFPNSHLDVVDLDGTVVCSSASVESGADHRRAPWLSQLADQDEAFMAESFLDELTGEPAVAFVAPVRGSEVLGAVTIVVPTPNVADELSQVARAHTEFTFALTDDAAGTVLSAGDGLEPRGQPMEDAGFISAARPVAGTSWTVHAGADPDVALSAARSVLVRGAILGGAVLAVLLAALAVVNRRIAAPLRRLARLVGDSGPQVHAELGQVQGPSEIVRLGADFRAAIEARERYEARLAQRELYDPVTGLANRALLAERLTLSLDRAARTDTTVGVLFVDLDRFKLINESLGHSVGDEVLAGVAQRLKPLLRAGDTLARFGGDEFVFVRDGTDGPDLDDVAQRILDSLEAPIEAADTLVRVTASVGIVPSDRDGGDDDLVRDAHAAMYLAKGNGRSRFEWFEPARRSEASARLAMETELQAAIERGELRLLYQPKVDLRTSTVVGVEALLRWDHPALGPVPPETFIPLAEETGLMVPIGEFVLREACQQAAAWQREGTSVPVAVNVSGRQFDTPDFAARVRSILQTTGLHPANLCLEITETLLMSDTVRSTQLMRDIHAVGVQLSIDDFGTGYSSLAYLHRFAFDELKIDRAFIDGIVELAGQRTLVEATVAMGKALGLTVVAEGVETDTQAALLRQLGCDVAQGYLYSRPQPAEAIRLPVSTVARPF